MGGLIFGYDIGISGGVTSMAPFLDKFFPSVYRKEELDHSTNQYCKFNSQTLTMFTSSLYLAALFASFFASTMTKKLGCKFSMLMGNCIFCCSALLNAFAVHLAMLIIGRILLGVGVGFATQSGIMLVLQCRHRTMDFVAAWKNLKKDKPCTIKFCHKCLCNRIWRKNRRSGIFGGLKLSEVQRHLQLQFLQEEARTPTHWYACAHSQDNWFFLCSEILHAKEGNTIDGIMLKETSTKKSRISNGVSKKEVKTSQTVGVVEEKKNLETRISKGVSSKLIKHGKNKEGRHCRKQTNSMKEGEPEDVLEGLRVDRDSIAWTSRLKIRSWIEDQNSKFAEKGRKQKKELLLQSIRRNN
ncbi:unnamed protein product [Camellia sinensis]